MEVVEASASATVEQTDLGIHTKTHLSRRVWRMASRVISASWDTGLTIAIGRLEFANYLNYLNYIAGSEFISLV